MPTAPINAAFCTVEEVAAFIADEARFVFHHDLTATPLQDAFVVDVTAAKSIPVKATLTFHGECNLGNRYSLLPTHLTVTYDIALEQVRATPSPTGTRLLADYRISDQQPY